MRPPSLKKGEALQQAMTVAIHLSWWAARQPPAPGQLSANSAIFAGRQNWVKTKVRRDQTE